jgi:hypothetical protein
MQTLIFYADSVDNAGDMLSLLEHSYVGKSRRCRNASRHHLINVSFRNCVTVSLGLFFCTEDSDNAVWYVVVLRTLFWYQYESPIQRRTSTEEEHRRRQPRRQTSAFLPKLVSLNLPQRLSEFRSPRVDYFYFTAEYISKVYRKIATSGTSVTQVLSDIVTSQVLECYICSIF